MPHTVVDADPEIALICEGIEMSFGGVPVLKGVDLELRPGTVTALGTACTARQAAATLSHYGGGVPWWRVVQAAGTLADEVLPAARTHLVAEGVGVVGRRVPLQELRWQPDLVVLRAELTLGG